MRSVKKFGKITDGNSKKKQVKQLFKIEKTSFHIYT